MNLLRSTAFVGLVLSLSVQTFAQRHRGGPPTTAPTTAESPAGPDITADPKLVVTRHSITLDGKPLDYTATTGTLAMKDEAGKVKANIFFVAYTTDAEPATRPVTFCFNGGPGAAAVWLHLGGVGPKTLVLGDDSEPVGPPYKLADNPGTWLRGSDLVFIDPVSTGFSRPAPGESADQFHGYRNDIASVGEFIRVYVTKYRRWASPIYLAGESYGTTRCAGLVGYLFDRYGIPVSGVTLVSSVLDFATLMPSESNDLPFSMYLPSYTAVAWYHKKLSAEKEADFDKTIDAARKFTADEYVPALAKGASLTPEQRRHVVRLVSELTGLSQDLVERNNLRVMPGQFEKQLLGDGHQIVGRYDGRITGYDAEAGRGSPGSDPSLSHYQPAYASAFNGYVRDELKYESDLPYETLTGVQPWPLTNERGGGGSLYVIDDLQNTLLEHPKLRVQFISGYYDLATPFYSADYTINRMQLSDEAKGRVSHLYYPSGHMVYHNKESAKKMAEAMEKFVSP